MLLPYNVDRPARQIPYVTYVLMAINIFVFFVTVFISNVNLPADRVQGKAGIESVLKDRVKVRAAMKELLSQLRSRGLSISTESSDDATIDEMVDSMQPKARKFLAAQVAARENTEEGYDLYWKIKNSDATYVMEPHYSALDVFAYRPGDSSVIGKIVGLFGSMFLHGSLDHIIGNMLFLWVFGRAIEDALGPRVYLGAYLLCGIAATLLYHIMTMQFSPDAMQVPSFGASGAIMGVLGLFAPRFYRTPVRAYFMPVFLVASVIVSGMLYYLTHDVGISSFLAIFVTGGILYAYRHNLPWAIRKYPAAWFIGAWIGYSDLYPAIHALTWGKGTDTGDGTAHWAHIGGFFFGMMYAVLIGAHKEGKHEFMLEDAEKAYNLGDMIGAVSYSQNVLEREPGNPNAYEIMGKAWMKQSREEEALDNLEISIDNYLRIGEREKAAAAYLMTLEKYPLFILKSESQLAIGNQLAKECNFKAAAENLIKIPYTFPDAKEGEVALLRGAQLYFQHMNEPQKALQLLQYFWQKYPESQWMPQVERTWKMAQHQIEQDAQEKARIAAEEQAAAAESSVSSAPQRVRAVAPSVELEPVRPGNSKK